MALYKQFKDGQLEAFNKIEVHINKIEGFIRTIGEQEQDHATQDNLELLIKLSFEVLGIIDERKKLCVYIIFFIDKQQNDDVQAIIDARKRGLPYTEEIHQEIKAIVSRAKIREQIYPEINMERTRLVSCLEEIISCLIEFANSEILHRFENILTSLIDMLYQLEQNDDDKQENIEKQEVNSCSDLEMLQKDMETTASEVDEKVEEIEEFDEVLIEPDYDEDRELTLRNLPVEIFRKVLATVPCIDLVTAIIDGDGA